MEVIDALPRRQWGRRGAHVARAFPTPPAFDLSPPPWVAAFLAGAAGSADSAETTDTAAPAITVTTRRAGPLALVTARVTDAHHLDDAAFERRTADAYAAIARALRDAPANCPLRFWNYLPAIRRTERPGLDRYMAFNAGRYTACADWFGSPDAFARMLPTASAVGHDGTDLVVHALAGEAPGTAVENPRQVPSYHYSRRFGPRPPCFARATTARLDADGRSLLLVGGTASIRGEDSAHAGDLRAQSLETFENLAALVRAAGGAGLAAFESLRVYYVHPADRGAIVGMVTAAFPRLAEVEFVKADLCRPELLVEIEGVARAG